MERLAFSKYVTLIALPMLQVSFDLRNAVIALSLENMPVTESRKTTYSVSVTRGKIKTSAQLDLLDESLLYESCYADYGLDVRERKILAGLSLVPRSRKQH